MSIQFRCHHCNKRIQAPDTASGRNAKCPVCGHAIEVPRVLPDDDPLAGFDDYMAARGSQQVPPPPPLLVTAESSDDLRAKDSQINDALHIARKNWRDWRDVYEHSGPISRNPLLAEPGIRFGSFCKEYSVHRTIRAGTQQTFRRELARSQAFLEAIQNGSGHDLDVIEPTLRERFGTHDPPRRMISVLSKVAAFLKPERFVAWDQYAKKGVNVLIGGRANRAFNSYADYLAAFETVWNGEPGKMIREFIIRNDRQGDIETQTRFLRRILDVYAMKCGGRWSE